MRSQDAHPPRPHPMTTAPNPPTGAAPLRVVITGGLGFLGQHLTASLLEQAPNCRILLLDLTAHPRPTHDFEANARVERRLGRDVCAPESFAADVAGADVVIHLAGVISFARRDRERLYRVNVEGTRNVLETALRARVPRFIHVSSVAALGYGPDGGLPIDESHRFDWRHGARIGKHYMLSKKAADDLVRARSAEIETTILYPGLMLGPGDRTTAIKFVAPIATGNARLTAPGGTNVVDVRDVARGIGRVVAGGGPTGEYALSGHNVDFVQLGREIATVLGVRAPNLVVPRLLERPLYHAVRVAEALSHRTPALTADGVHSAFRHRYYSNARARAELGWVPEIPFETTIRDTVQWLLENDDGALGRRNRRE